MSRFHLADPRGGVLLTDEGGLVTAAIKQIGKQLVKNILSGKMMDILKMKSPVNIHIHRSYLDVLEYECVFLEGMLFELKDKNLLDNPVERVKYVMTACLANLHYSMWKNGLKSPLNPILGETACRKTKRGTMLYCEQTSHHPPISHFYMVGPPELPFKLHGYLEFKIGISQNWTTVVASTPGRVTLDFPNGARLEMSDSKQVEVSGMLSSSKLFNVIGQLKVTDVKEQIHAVITFDP